MKSRSGKASDSSVSPAPYGRSCMGCSRAKCKCFYRSDGSGCERCHRLGRSCEPPVSLRRRRGRELPYSPAVPSAASSSHERLEEKLDNIVSMLRMQGIQRPAADPTAASLSSFDEASANLNAASTSTPDSGEEPLRHPEVVIDVDDGVVHLLRPDDELTRFEKETSVLTDATVHRIPPATAKRCLETFRHVFLPAFPFVFLSEMIGSEELRFRSPFLWLNVMAATATDVAQQFAMERTIWRIISQRVMVEHCCDMDIIHGLICFAAWSHYYKIDKPFMTKITDLASSLAWEMGLHRNASAQVSRHRGARVLDKRKPKQQERTLEERRTFVALYSLSSSTWLAYRKHEPLAWTPYLDDCMRILSEAGETPLDLVLIAQVRCQMITNQISCAGNDGASGEEAAIPPRTVLTAMLRQLNEIRQTLPDVVRSSRSVNLHLLHAELSTRATMLRNPSQTSRSFQRLTDLEETLSCAERWVAQLFDMPLGEWPSITVDIFTQMMYCFIVLLKLFTLEESGWDTDEVRRRVHVFEVIDRVRGAVDKVPAVTGMVDAPGERSGLFFKATPLFMAIKELFSRGTGGQPGEAVYQDVDGEQQQQQQTDSGDIHISEDLVMALADEPWLSDMFATSWDFGIDPFADFENQGA